MKPKKSLGQNFLTSLGAIGKIIAAADYSPNLTILEVGPGTGVLTEALLRKFDKVVSVEKDEGLAKMLEARFAREIEEEKFRLVAGDILEFSAKKLGLDNYAIVANIPYYITGQFLRDWLSTNPQPKFMVLMLQKEVAERIVAKDGKESLLSISVKVFGEPSYIATVKRGSFFPTPNVDSAILKISEISNHLGDKEKIFFEILKAGFAHKRKLLLSNLGAEEFRGRFSLCHLKQNARAEELTIGDWRCLSCCGGGLSTKIPNFMAKK